MTRHLAVTSYLPVACGKRETLHDPHERLPSRIFLKRFLRPSVLTQVTLREVLASRKPAFSSGQIQALWRFGVLEESQLRFARQTTDDNGESCHKARLCNAISEVTCRSH